MILFRKVFCCFDFIFINLEEVSCLIGSICELKFDFGICYINYLIRNCFSLFKVNNKSFEFV